MACGKKKQAAMKGGAVKPAAKPCKGGACKPKK